MRFIPALPVWVPQAAQAHPQALVSVFLQCAWQQQQQQQQSLTGLTRVLWGGAYRAEKQRLAKLYEAFRRINAGGRSLDQLVTIILIAVRNLVNSDHNLLLFVDNSRDQLWTKWTLGTIMDDKVTSNPSAHPCSA